MRPASASRSPLIDRFGRVHSDLRISVTDRCNIRCVYCMPADHVHFMPRSEILTFEEIERFVRVAASLGIRKLRLTGGEPLVRSELSLLVRLLAQIEGIEDIALTTNGVLLAEQARDLAGAGLKRLNISLDALDPDIFLQIARREGFERVLAGIHAALEAGFEKIKLNALVMRGVNESQIVPLAQFARKHDIEVRFIEYMPLDAEARWQSQTVVTGDEIRQTIEAALGPLVPADSANPSQPATDFQFSDGVGGVGFINPVSQPFCEACNRLRITADGKLRNCLFSVEEWDVRDLLRAGASDGEIADCIRACVIEKRAAHGINENDFVRPERAMYQIGG